MSSPIIELCLFTILLENPITQHVKELVLEKTVSPPDNSISNFFCSKDKEFEIFFKFLFEKDFELPLADIK